MIWELVYTSLEHGLLNGQSGFGVAAATAGIPGAVSDILCAGSGYNAVYPIHSPDYSKNPVSDFHYTINIGNAVYHWVGRCRCNGMDYSGRSNMIAHHLMIHEKVIGDALPETLFEDCEKAGFVVPCSFYGEARWLNPIPVLPKVQINPPAVAETWARYFGDSGLAGVLAQQAVEKSSPVYVVFKDGWDVKKLLTEAMALLPASMRWQISYNTYFTENAKGFVCDWRFCHESNPMLEEVRRKGICTVIDGNQAAPDSPWCDFARGKILSPLASKSGRQEKKSAAEKEFIEDVIENKSAKSSGNVRLRQINGSVPAGQNHAAGRFKELIVPLLLITVAIAGILWMIMSFAASGREDVSAAETVPESTPEVKPEKTPLRTVVIPEISVKPAEHVPDEKPQDTAPASQASQNSTAAETATAEPAATVPPVSIRPAELQDLSGKITMIALCARPGSADAVIELPSSLKPRLEMMPECSSGSDADGVISVKWNNIPLCRFLPPASPDGNWKLEILNNFLPGDKGFAAVSWHAEGAAKPVVMRFQPMVAAVAALPDYRIDEQYIVVKTVIPQNRQDYLLIDALWAAGLLDPEKYRWNHDEGILEIADEILTAGYHEYLQAWQSECQAYQQTLNMAISECRRNLEFCEKQGQAAWEAAQEEIRNFDRERPREPRGVDRDDYPRAERRYLEALERWEKRRTQRWEELNRAWNENYGQWIQGYKDELARLESMPVEPEISQEAKELYNTFSQNFQTAGNEWRSQDGFTLPLGNSQRHIVINFNNPTGDQL